MQPPARFDVLVIGSGASGLAAAVSAERAGARVALATKGSIQANNSSKAQGGIQAAFGADDSPELHAEDVMRSSHETADPRLVEILTGDAQSAIHWLEELGCAFTRENGGYRLARCGGASRQRLLQVGDRTGHAITKALREAHGERLSGVVLFGSEARGDADDDSDIDILVLLDGPIRYADDLLANLVALKGLSAELARRISPKPIDAESFLHDDSPLVRAAREEGMRI